MSTITREQAQKIIAAADEVITALAGTNEDVHPESDNMLRLWDDLNDRYAPPEVVRELARIALASLEAEKGVEPVAKVETVGVCWYADNGVPRKPAVGTELFSAPPAPVVSAELRNRLKVEGLAELVKDARENAPLTADQWETLTNNWFQTFVGLSGEDDACRAAMLQGAGGNSPVIPDGSEDTKRLDWLDAQNKRLNEYYGTSYGWKFDANFQRNAMMLNDSNYPVMTVRQAIDEAIAAAPQQEAKP